MAYCSELECWQSKSCSLHGKKVEVTLIRTIVVQCAHSESVRTLDVPFRLGPFDSLVAPFIPVVVLFVYEDKQLQWRRLQRAIECVLDYYPHLTGRLVLHKNGIREIDALGTGAEFVLAESKKRLEDFHGNDRLGLLDLPDAGNALLPPLNMAPDAVFTNALLTIQHTRFACGSVALGVRLPHTLCDAVGFFQFVQDLAELYRNEGRGLSTPPFIQSFYSELTNISDVEKKQNQQVKPRSLILSYQAPISSEFQSSSAPITGRVMRFSAHELESLKTCATDSSKGWVTTYEALAAHLWQSVYRARMRLHSSALAPNSTSPEELHTDFLTPFNWRPKDRLNLPEKYFGNALSTPCIAPPHNTLAHATLSEVTSLLHDLLREQKREEQDLTLRWIMSQPDLTQIQGTFRYGNGGIMISEWSKFNMYDIAFDNDEANKPISPILVTTPFTPISLMDGLGYFLPTKEASRSIDVNLALIDPLWSILDSDPDFRRFRPSSFS